MQHGKAQAEQAKAEAEFLERLTAGESHTAITDDPHMPDWSTVYRWAKADKEFAADIAEAKFERGCHYGYLVGNRARPLAQCGQAIARNGQRETCRW